MELTIILLVMVIWIAISSSWRIKRLQLREKELEWRIEALEKLPDESLR